jgi:transcriptional regulator with XRE-family HTH domain
MPIRKYFGEQVRRRRRALNLSQEELAHMAGINRSHMGQIERGKKNAGLTTVASIANALNCNVAMLLDFHSE